MGRFDTFNTHNKRQHVVEVIKSTNCEKLRPFFFAHDRKNSQQNCFEIAKMFIINLNQSLSFLPPSLFDSSTMLDHDAVTCSTLVFCFPRKFVSSSSWCVFPLLPVIRRLFPFSIYLCSSEARCLIIFAFLARSLFALRKSVSSVLLVGLWHPFFLSRLSPCFLSYAFQELLKTIPITKY